VQGALAVLSVVLACLLSCDRPSAALHEVRDLDGTWRSVHVCNDNLPDGPRYASVLVIDGRHFDVWTYRDTAAAGPPDTSFSGDCFITSDSASFTVENFTQVYYWFTANSMLKVELDHEIQPDGRKVADVHSFFTVCEQLDHLSFSRR